MTTVTPLISAMVDRTRTSYRLMRNDRYGSILLKKSGRQSKWIAPRD
jgi:hypothetical protein